VLFVSMAALADYEVGSGVPLQLTSSVVSSAVSASGVAIVPSTLCFQWSFVSLAAQASGAAPSALPDSTSGSVLLDAALLAYNTTYNVSVSVTDSSSIYTVAGAAVPAGASWTLLHIKPARVLVVQVSVGVDPCKSDPTFVCLNGGTCQATQTPAAAGDLSPPRYTLSCVCPTTPVQFYGSTCGLAVLECPGCVSHFLGGAQMSLYGLGLDSTRLVTVGGREVSFAAAITVLNASDPNSLALLDADAQAVVGRWPAYPNIQRLDFLSPALVTAPNTTAQANGTSTDPSRRLLDDGDGSADDEQTAAAVAVVNPPSAYELLTVSSLLLDTSGSALLSINISNFIYYSSSTCLAEGTWKPDGLGDCLGCPDGGYCPGGGRVWPLAGWWSWNEFQAPIRCAVAAACPGVTPGSTSDAAALSYIDTQQCGEGYQSARCAQCSDGYYQIGGAPTCYYCGSTVDQQATITLTVLVGVGVMGAMAAGVAVLRAMQLAQAVQMFMLAQGTAAVGVAGARSSPYFGEQLHTAMVYLNFINFDIEVIKPSATLTHARALRRSFVLDSLIAFVCVSCVQWLRRYTFVRLRA